MNNIRYLNQKMYWQLMVLNLNLENLGDDASLQLVNESEFAIVNDNMALVKTDDFCSIMTAKDGVIVSVKEVSSEVWDFFCK